MRYYFRHVGRFLCLLVTLHVFVLTARAEASLDADGYDIELDGDAVISNGESSDLPIKPATHIFPEHHHNKKYQTGKHISFKVIISETKIAITYVAYKDNETPVVMPEKYAYLFFQEINPPPPKAL